MVAVSGNPVGRKTPKHLTSRGLLKVTFDNHLSIVRAVSIEVTFFSIPGKAHLFEASVLSLAD